MCLLEAVIPAMRTDSIISVQLMKVNEQVHLIVYSRFPQQKYPDFMHLYKSVFPALKKI